MSEKALQRRFVKELKRYGHAQSHEDLCSPGIPDTSFGIQMVNGWVEIKKRRKWPARIATLVKPDHPLTIEQLKWLIRRGDEGGHCFILYQVGQNYFLFSWERAEEFYAHLSAEQLYNYSIANWHKSIDYDELVKEITA